MGKRLKKQKVIIETVDRINMWKQRMLRLAISCIKWEGLPDTVDTVYLEYLLSRNGSAIFVMEKDVGLLVGQNASTGPLDIYGYPKDRSVIFRNGSQAWYSVKESVIVYNNSMRSSDLWMYDIVSNDMANIDMAVRVNINSQKTMPMIPSSQQQALTAKNLYHDIEENKGYRIIDENSMDIEKFKSAIQFDNRKSFTSDNMIAVQRELWNRMLTIMGINNVNVEKRERVNTFETNANLDEIQFMRRDRLNSREQACKQLKKFGLDVTVSYYSDIRVGGEGIVGIYNASQDDL